MSQPPSRPSTVARATSPASSLTLSAALGDQLSTLYRLAQQSEHIFGSPLGPFTHAGQSHHLPRFVYFGPHTSEESPRVAFLAGLDHRDLRPTLALLHLVEELALKPSLGQSLHLAFYPLIDVVGHLPSAGTRTLAGESWTKPASPEIDLLSKESRLRSYHAFVRIESVLSDDTLTLVLRTAPGSLANAPLISSDDAGSLPIRWEIESGPPASTGPQTLGDDLPFRPLDLTLRVPASWTPEFYREAVASILKRFIVRYRSFLAYGQHL